MAQNISKDNRTQGVMEKSQQELQRVRLNGKCNSIGVCATIRGDITQITSMTALIQIHIAAFKFRFPAEVECALAVSKEVFVKEVEEVDNTWLREIDRSLPDCARCLLDWASAATGPPRQSFPPWSGESGGAVIPCEVYVEVCLKDKESIMAQLREAVERGQQYMEENAKLNAVWDRMQDFLLVVGRPEVPREKAWKALEETENRQPWSDLLAEVCYKERVRHMPGQTHGRLIVGEKREGLTDLLKFKPVRGERQDRLTQTNTKHTGNRGFYTCMANKCVCWMRPIGHAGIQSPLLPVCPYGCLLRRGRLLYRAEGEDRRHSGGIFKVWNHDWMPSHFIVDKSNMEINALKTEFPAMELLEWINNSEVEPREELDVVESLVSKKRMKGQIHCQVKWQSYRPEFNTWEPYKNLVKWLGKSTIQEPAKNHTDQVVGGEAAMLTRYNGGYSWRD
ncbi:hypothetical protein Bbelb_282900 [Branchiostoma belcheri]|nr:hypothetical protein Bbelb_282900 [Branchiostoma belcheri]